jgi:hypothetical protein
LSEQLPCLEVLDLRNQPQVTNRGVRQLASSSSSLAARPATTTSGITKVRRDLC